MHLFMAYVGGYTKNANVELYDVRFVVGESIEACYPQLVEQWWGDREMFHLDAWGVVQNVDGFDIHVQSTCPDQSEKLYFVNLGGYDPHQFTELHHNALVIATHDMEAKTKAKAKIQDWKPHKDNCFEVERMLALTTLGDSHIRLEKTDPPKPFEFTCAFRLITNKKVAKNA